MPTLATGTSVSKPHRIRRIGRGFTLIEIMVVVFIVGLVSAAAVITFGGDRRDTELDREGERLDALMDYAREQAELQTRDYGFRIDRFTYTFVVFDPLNNQWRLVEEDEALRERKLPEGLVPKLVLEGRPVVLEIEKKKIQDFKPQVLIFSNGDMSSFEVSFQREGTGDIARLSSDEDGNVRLLLPGETEALVAQQRANPQAQQPGGARR